MARSVARPSNGVGPGGSGTSEEDNGTHPDQGPRQDLRRLQRRQRHQHGDQGRRVHDHGRPVRMRQDDHAQHDLRARDADVGPDHHRQHRGQRPRARRARPRHGVPGSRPLPAHDGVREHRLRPAHQEEVAGRDRQARDGGSRSRAHQAALAEAAAPMLGRREPACCARAHYRDQSVGIPDGRAAVQPRCEAARRHAHGAEEPACAPEGHLRLCHARPGRSHDHGRQHRGDEQGQDRAAGHAARDLQQRRPPSSLPASSARRR